MESTSFYKSERARNTVLFRQYQKQSRHLATLRVLVFVAELIVFVYLVNIRELAWAIASLLIFILFFAFLVKRFNRVVFQRNQHKFIADINSEELARLEGTFKPEITGIEYLTEKHPYAKDIDIFGKHSIFTLINRTSTFPGKDLLASRLLGRHVLPEITRYQQAVQEMAGKPEFMQAYRALGLHISSTQDDYSSFLAWLHTPGTIVNRAFFRWVLWLLPLLLALSVSVAFFFSFSYYICLPLVILNGYFLAKYHRHISQVVEKTSASVRLLQTYVRHLALIEANNFQSSFMRRQLLNFTVNGVGARHEIAQLSALLDNLQTRKNLLHVFINIPLLLDLQWLFKLEKWQSGHKDKIEGWIATFAETEVIISLAGQAFAEPGWSYPKIIERSYAFAGSDIGHPLINRHNRIYNTFELEGEGRVVLLTGPNMAGKSTFLRTIAVNIILAKMGSVVCASALAISNDYNLFTSMRTEDDLSESVSSFYAELMRIKHLLDTIANGKKVMFFLDEILKGTNSEDRHKGAEALIRQLIALNVTGFVSTHDIALGQLTKELQGVSNYSFESTIQDDTISFDYTLKEGICTSFNACTLMRNMGINV